MTDDADDVYDIGNIDELDVNERRPVDVAKSFNFCEKPMLGGFTANEWCAITAVDGSVKADEFNL